MPLRIDLLGAPALRDDEERTPPRGRKAWGLLAYLLCRDAAASREHLAELLFAEADDPLGALRWNLAQLRRALGAERVVAVRGGIAIEDVDVDVRVLQAASWTEAIALPGLGRELLEGMDFGSAPGFDAWLQVERSRLRGVAEAVLHESALAELAAGRPVRAAEAAARLVALNAFDENFHELLVRSHARAGDRQAARRAADACAALFARELGRAPGPAVAAAVADGDRRAAPPPGAASARAQLEAGRSAVDAGAVDAGISALRGAAAAARGCGDDALLARALLALGQALVHSVKGRDEEGAAALRRAALVAQGCGTGELGVTACRELAYVEVLCGRYDRALGLLDRIRPSAAGHPGEAAAIDSVSGMALSDTGRHAAAREHLGRAMNAAETAGQPRRFAYALSMAGRIDALEGDLDAARDALERSLEITLAESWLGFAPWPEALLAEVELAAGDAAAAEERFAHAFALGCHLEDPCWEGLAARGLALVEAPGDAAAAIERLGRARTRALAAVDGYRWVGAHALDALCALAAEHGDPRAGAWIAELRSLASRTGMRELAAHAYLHDAALGTPGAADAARALADEVDNPALRRRCAAVA